MRKRVLIQARTDLNINPGGDRVLINKSSKALIELGIDVSIDIKGSADIKNFDLVHIYNFATPDQIRPFAERAVREKVPYIVTTLYEDRAQFYQQMHIYGHGVNSYIDSKQTADWNAVEKICTRYLGELTTDAISKNKFIADNAETLVSSGNSESQLLKRDFPNARKIASCHFASSSLPDQSPQLFKAAYGVSDYILSVGRVEYRKNHGMLLAALENDPRTLVGALPNSSAIKNSYFD